MVNTISITSKKSEIDVNFFPSIDLGEKKWELGLLNFHSFNTIPNIDLKNNKFHFDDGKGLIEIPIGSYEINELSLYLTDKIKEYYSRNNKNQDEKDVLLLHGDSKTLKTTIYCIYSIDFSKENSIGPFLGFSGGILERKKSHTSQNTINITKVNTIRVITNITTGAYVNNKPTQSIFEFPIDVDHGYRMSIVPKNVIYFPIIVKSITDLHIEVIDQDFDLVNFRDQELSILLHLRPTPH